MTGHQTMTTVQGMVAKGFEDVREVFAAVAADEPGLPGERPSTTMTGAISDGVTTCALPALHP